MNLSSIYYATNNVQYVYVWTYKKDALVCNIFGFDVSYNTKRFVLISQQTNNVANLVYRFLVTFNPLCTTFLHVRSLSNAGFVLKLTLSRSGNNPIPPHGPLLSNTGFASS